MIGLKMKFEKRFDQKKESLIYQSWENKGLFNYKLGNDFYHIPMPPPNITGSLHMGHAVFITIQDIMVRHKRMKGKTVVWPAGIDHGGIATQKRIQKIIGSGSFSDNSIIIDKYLLETKQTINNQIKGMGASCDWSNQRYTLDEDYSKSVIYAFKECEKQGRISESNGNFYLDVSDLASQLSEDIKSGLIKIKPENKTGRLTNFLDNIEPWCISRQIEWGHKIPIEGNNDVLDTWFSSSLWPFATLGWPKKTKDMENFYPASCIETGDDILFFWCGRMLMMGKMLTGQYPFSKIYLHGIMRDDGGVKMSKSLGNGIDPMPLIEQAGCDALRFYIAESSSGKDVNFSNEGLQSGRALVNKFWNCQKFLGGFYEKERVVSTNISDINILSQIKESSLKISKHIDDFNIHLAAAEFRTLLFDSVSSLYIEHNKQRLFNGCGEARSTASEVFDCMILLFHPFAPFVTQGLSDKVGFKDVMINNYFERIEN